MQDFFLALVARRFYLDNASKSEIAAELGISRFRVARLLDQAVRDGVVHIRVSPPPEIDLELSDQVAQAYGLTQAVVLSAPAAGDTTELRAALAQACSTVLTYRLRTGDVFGIAWGRTLSSLADTATTLLRIPVVQLVGSLPTADLGVDSPELLRRLHHRVGGTAHPLHVPWVVDSRRTADCLRATGHVQRTLAKYNDVTFAAVEISAWTPTGSALRALLPHDEARRFDALGAVAEICGTILNADGLTLNTSNLASRCIAITTAQLRHVGDVMGIATGAENAAAVSASAKSGLLQRLVIDTPAALALLELDRTPEYKVLDLADTG